jgi:hypothetical protein
MSILNSSSDGQLNILIAFARTLVAEGSSTKERLLRVCVPASLERRGARASPTLTRWTELGLFELKGDEVDIAEQFKARLNKRHYSTEQLTACVRECVFADENNDQFWQAEENRAADFTRLQAWVLAQDVYTFSGKYADVEAMASQQASGLPVIQNDTRWSPFISWSVFLGFSQAIGSQLFVDPTTAVALHVGECLPEAQETPVHAFIAALAERVPVIDGGRYRQSVEQRLDRSAWAAPKDNEISASLSRSLLRLQEDGVLQLLDHADAPKKVSLLGREGTTMSTVSHVKGLRK